ncbi:MAG: hypothetical protein KME64_44195 [Scytonematopsis contorta HA4267-MV1]|jgi:hypothetical protein|nr:hypothetical protein [Scytonematopsis contorta HA4267-MV1]
MKTNNLLQVLPRLSSPWLISSATQRRQKIETLSYSSNEIQKALNVLEQCLETLSQFTVPSLESIPESLREYWDFSVESLAENIPTLDDFDLTKVVEFLKKEGVESPSKQIIQDVASWWIWSVVQDIAKTVLIWLEDSFKEAKDAAKISHFIDIAERYWQKVDPHLAQFLLSRSALIGREKALPLLESVESQTLVSSSVRVTVQDYRKLILGTSDMC